VIQKIAKFLERALKVNVVFPQRIVRINQQVHASLSVSSINA
jgi:hypothetical protein